jgi:hypothetical protein
MATKAVPSLLLIAAFCVGGPSAASAEENTASPPVQTLVDRVLVAVGDTPITASQLAFETEVRAQIDSSPRKQDFGRLLNEAVDPLEALIFREILRRLPPARTISVDEAVARSRLRLFEGSFETPSASASFRARWGIDRTALLEFFKESVVLDEVVELSVVVQVSEQEKRNYYERNKNRVFGDKPEAEVSDFIAQQVYLLKFEAEYNSWRSRLRASAQKRYIGR